MRINFYTLSIFLLASLGLTSCNGGSSSDAKQVEISFLPYVGADPWTCGNALSNLGTTNETGEITDFRLYIHEVTLISDADDEYPVNLKNNDWQTAGVTLLDFANKAGCDGETKATNMKAIGSYKAPADTLITGIKFSVGVPFDLNHANRLEAESPLNIASMNWNWQGGYKFVRIEATIADTKAYLFHLGSVGCDGDPGTGGTTGCTYENVPQIELSGFDIDESAVKIDFQALIQDTDLSGSGPFNCHAMAAEADICEGAFDNLGLDFYDGSGVIPQATTGQTVFTSILDPS